MKKRIAYKIYNNRKRELFDRRPLVTIKQTESGVTYTTNFSSRYTRKQLQTAINKVNKDLNKNFNRLYHGTNPN